MVVLEDIGKWCERKQKTGRDECREGEVGMAVHESKTCRRPRAPVTSYLTTTMDPPQLIPASYLKYHLPYFTPQEVEHLSEKLRGKLSITQEERVRQQACGFIEAIGLDIGL